MKTRDLEQILIDKGFYFLKNSKHRIFSNGKIIIAVPHHVEINKFLAKKILRQADEVRKVA